MDPSNKDSCDDDSRLLSHPGPLREEAKPSSGLRYTTEELIELRPLKNDYVQEKPPSIITGNELQASVSEKKVENIEQDQVHNMTEIEPDGNGVDKDLGNAMYPEGDKQKKKRKKKNKKQVPSGFEEYYADTPITPEEYNEEKNDLYHHSRSFVERIQQCIQRYRARRKLDSIRADIFSKYLVLGGVDTGVKAFGGGLDQDTLDNSTAAEIADIRATDHIRSSGPIKFYNAGDPVNWVVDFEGVAKGFLSELAPAVFGTHERDIKQYCGVISNFLNYVLLHDVCNEYQMDVLAALRICTKAEKELKLVGEVSKLLPGDFNIAASTLYGGSYRNKRDGYVQWDEKTPVFEPDDTDAQNKKLVGMTTAEADRIFKTAIAFSGTYEHFQQIMAINCYLVKSETRTMEVCEIVLPNEEARQKLIRAKEEFGHSGFALGILKVKHWDSPDAPDEDMSDDGKEDSGDTKEAAESTIDSLWLEENILEKCFIGMKLQATVRELSIGLKYIDEVMRVECSFYTYLETERLDRWKEPRVSDRPGPTVDDVQRDYTRNVDGDED